ncbi:hypothetical protein KC345_g11663, partial [Hortaea werneckii]
IQIPPLIIQPLVENCVIHGLENRMDGGMVRVDIRIEDAQLKVQVSDNGTGISAARMEEIRHMLDNKDDYETHNIGMRNIHLRLQLTYGLECGLTLASQSGFGTQISYAIPLRRLMTLLDWESLGYRVVDTAANAVEARYKYELYSPDLMIIDIRMPGKDGLELIRELREDQADTHIIILSGYADFSYAKRALNFGIDSYLLKPVDEDELQLYLTSLSTVLSARIAERRNHAAVKVWSREMLVQSLLMESSLHPAPALMDSAMESGLLWDSYQIVLIRLLLQDYADNGPSTAVKARLTASFDSNSWGIVFSLDSYVGVLLQPSFQKELVRKLMVQNIREAACAEGLECIITAGDMVDTLEELSVSHQSALARMKDHFFYDEPGMIGPDSLKLKTGLPARPQEAESSLAPLVDRLYFAMDIGNLAVIPSLIQESGDIL